MKTYYFDTIDSTNAEAIRRYRDGERGDMLFVADHQTNGRGRKGRDFYSPKGTGVYMTFLFDEFADYAKAEILTPLAGTVVTNVLRTYGLPVMIKWVNDLFLYDKKVCGILAEAITAPDGKLEAVVLGIGINFTTEDFPEEIRGVAGCLSLGDGAQKEVTEKIAGLMELVADKLRGEGKEAVIQYMDKYREYSMVIGRTVKCISGESVRIAVVDDIDNDGELLVTYEDGEKAVLNSGEISIKL